MLYELFIVVWDGLNINKLNILFRRYRSAAGAFNKRLILRWFWSRLIVCFYLKRYITWGYKSFYVLKSIQILILKGFALNGPIVGIHSRQMKLGRSMSSCCCSGGVSAAHASRTSIVLTFAINYRFNRIRRANWFYGLVDLFCFLVFSFKKLPLRGNCFVLRFKTSFHKVLLQWFNVLINKMVNIN